MSERTGRDRWSRVRPTSDGDSVLLASTQGHLVEAQEKCRRGDALPRPLTVAVTVVGARANATNRGSVSDTREAAQLTNAYTSWRPGCWEAPWHRTVGPSIKIQSKIRA